MCGLIPYLNITFVRRYLRSKVSYSILYVLKIDRGITLDSAVNHMSQPRPRQGNSAPNSDPIMGRETDKNNKYKAAATAVHKNSSRS